LNEGNFLAPTDLYDGCTSVSSDNCWLEDWTRGVKWKGIWICIYIYDATFQKLDWLVLDRNMMVEMIGRLEQHYLAGSWKWSRHR
jgi:hypothetical protein